MSPVKSCAVLNHTWKEYRETRNYRVKIIGIKHYNIDSGKKTKIQSTR